MERGSWNELYRMRPMPACTRARVRAGVIWGVSVHKGYSAGLHGTVWATWPETLVIWFDGKTEPRESHLWNGISLTGKVSTSAPVACCIQGAEAFCCSSAGFEIRVREILVGFTGCAYPRGLRKRDHGFPACRTGA